MWLEFNLFSLGLELIDLASKMDIISLLETAPYEASTCTALENHLQTQLTNRTYDFNANKALLKYYHLSPDSIKLDHVCHLLILSIMRLPASDFHALIYLLPPKCMGHSRVETLQNCHKLLEQGKFADFWDVYVSIPAAQFAPVSGFVDFIRLFIVGTLRNSFKKMPKNLFAQQLGLNDSTIEPFCQGNKFVEKVDGDNVVFTECEDNKPRVASVTAIRPDEVNIQTFSSDIVWFIHEFVLFIIRVYAWEIL